MGRLMVERYCAFFSAPTEATPQGVTLAALQLPGIERVAAAVQTFAALMPPAPGKTVSPYYAETAYAQATGWGDFLRAYYTAMN